MAEKLGLGTEVRELKLGESFTNPRSTAFHTVRYDFKPASVDINESATIDVGSNNQITVNVPLLNGSGTSQTVFKGSHKPYQKECVLIIDKNTGQITLERLTSNIQVKKTRPEALHKSLLPQLADKLEPSMNSSSTILSSSKMGSKLSRKNKKRTERQSLPDRLRTPIKGELVSVSPCAPPSLAASLPLIGIDDFPMGNKLDEHMEMASPVLTPYQATPVPEPTTNKGKHTSTDDLSDCSSSSSSDDTELDNDVNIKTLVNNFSSLNTEIKVSDCGDSMPEITNPINQLLNEDLYLSESD